MLTNKVPLLESKIVNLEKVNSNWVQVDSLRSTQITMYRTTLEDREQSIKRLKKSVKTTRYIAGGGILAAIIATLVCVLK